ncbi:MAG: putative sulfate exporter family transporter, partial [Clostridia bacterium]
MILTWIKKNSLGILLSAILALIGIFLSNLIPHGLISGGVFALLIGMALNPLFTKKKDYFINGFNFTSKIVLKAAIVSMGVTLSFSQVLEVGKFSIIVMSFTLIAAFGFGYLFGKLFKMNWKLSSLISAGTGICGGSAIAAISPVIDAKDSDVAYAISATFIFDIIMVIVFPIVARALNMSDMGYGLWAGTAVNDTSSVVAAGYAFSDAAGNFAVIVKLTRTLSIIPIVIIFSAINSRINRKEALKVNFLATLENESTIIKEKNTNAIKNVSTTAIKNESTVAIKNESATATKNKIGNTQKINWKKIFPWFILLF